MSEPAAASRGSYGPNFFGYSVTHDATLSRQVLGTLKGSFAANREAWRKAPVKQRQVLLAEDHESAHHQLISGTPCGLLLWRLNQVIHRDIDWARLAAAEYTVVPPRYASPRDFYESAELRQRLSASGCRPEVADYIALVIANITNCLIVRDIFFAAGSARSARHARRTIGELADRLNMAFDWMSQRCGIPWTATWKVRGNDKALLFSGNQPINAHDIAEAHAVAHELSVIRAFADPSGFTQRYEAVFGTVYEPGVEVGRQGLPNVADVPFSPFLLRHRALLSFCTSIDLTVARRCEGEVFLEDHLPWLRFASLDIFHGDNLGLAADSLNALASNEIYTSEANWAPLTRVDEDSDIQEVATNMAWLGMDLQVFAFHRNAEAHLQYLIGYAKKEMSPYDAIDKSALNSNYLIEYADQLCAMAMDLERVYGEQWPALADLGFDRFRIPGMQTLCHLLNGAGSRNVIAHYLREQVPSPDIVIPKLAASLQRQYSASGLSQVKIDQLVSAATALLRRLIENGKFGTEGEAGFLVNDQGRFIQ